MAEEQHRGGRPPGSENRPGAKFRDLPRACWTSKRRRASCASVPIACAISRRIRTIPNSSRIPSSCTGSPTAVCSCTTLERSGASPAPGRASHPSVPSGTRSQPSARIGATQ